MNIQEKLIGFPTIYYTSLSESESRRMYMNRQLKKYGIKGIPYITERFEDTGIVVTGQLAHAISSPEKGVGSSHIMNLHKWYSTTNEPYAIFAEDDIDLSVIDLWNFSWKQFVSKLPRNWQSVQLIRINPFQTMEYKEEDGIHIRKRMWTDWGCTYLINRHSAKEILDKHYVDEKTLDFTLGYDLFPFPENLMYYSYSDPINTVYSVPLFVENTFFKSTFIKDYVQQGFKDYDTTNGAKLDQYKSSEYYMAEWVKYGSKLNIDKIMECEDVYYRDAVGMNRIVN